MLDEHEPCMDFFPVGAPPFNLNSILPLDFFPVGAPFNLNSILPSKFFIEDAKAMVLN